MRTEYVRHTTGSTLYAKPSPLANSPWSTGVVTATENGSTGEYAIDELDEATPYTVFIQAGVSPASNDAAIATIDRSKDANSGLGARTVTISVTIDSVEVEGAYVRLTKGAESYTATTDVDGVAVFNVNDGTWTVAITASGAMFSGATLVVDGDETQTYDMNSITITPSDPGLRTGYLVCYDETGAVESNATVSCKCIYAPSTGLALDSQVREEVSGADGVVEFTNLIVGAKYTYRRGGHNERSITVQAGSGSFALDSIVGNE